MLPSPVPPGKSSHSRDAGKLLDKVYQVALCPLTLAGDTPYGQVSLKAQL